MQDDDLFGEGASLVAFHRELATETKDYRARMEDHSEVSIMILFIQIVGS